MIELGARLSAMAYYVPRGSKVIDIGTDHAYLPIYLVQQKICPEAFGVDVNEGPYRSAIEQVNIQGLRDKIKIYLGDGLKPLKPGQGNVVVVAGMGGTTIREILEASPEVLGGVQRLILQPMGGGASLRLWLLENGWTIIDEQLVEEEGRIYEIIVAEPGVQKTLPSELMLELGPVILANKDSLLPKLIKSKLKALETVVGQMKQAQRPEVQRKRQEVVDRIRELHEVLAWLSPVK